MSSRPAGVPTGAVHVPEDAEWELGERRDDRRVGHWMWWRDDGSLCCESTFDDDGQLHGESRRYHPNGETSLVAPYLGGRLHGKQIATRPSSGDSPEMRELLELDGVWRLEMLYIDGVAQPGMTTLYAREGLFDPVAHDAEGRAVDLTTQLHKLRPGTALELCTPFLDTMSGRRPRSKITALQYICPALVGGAIHRVQARDRHGATSIEIVGVSAFDQSLSLAVDRALARLAVSRST